MDEYIYPLAVKRMRLIYQISTERGNEPTADDLANLNPLNSAASKPCDSNTGDGTYNGVGGRDGPSA